jgi:hypothetical protein
MKLENFELCHHLFKFCKAWLIMAWMPLMVLECCMQITCAYFERKMNVLVCILHSGKYRGSLTCRKKGDVTKAARN